jgi:hypothetical protein
MNAQEEFLKHVGNRKVKCAIIHRDRYDGSSDILLKENHTAVEYKSFIKSLYFEYMNGYGGQELFGTIWYLDGTWSDRGEYDGSEWWQYNSCPEIPKNLMNGKI